MYYYCHFCYCSIIFTISTTILWMYIYMYIYICLLYFMYVHYIYIHMYLDVYVCTSTFVCMYIYIYILMDRERERERVRERESPIDNHSGVGGSTIRSPWSTSGDGRHVHWWPLRSIWGIDVLIIRIMKSSISLLGIPILGWMTIPHQLSTHKKVVPTSSNLLHSPELELLNEYFMLFHVI